MKNIFRKVKLESALILTFVLAVAISVGCTKDIGKEPVTVNIDASIEDKSVEQLFKESSLIVKGEVKSYESLKIKSTTGALANFTDYTFNIQEIFRGNVDNETVTVRVQGGTVGELREVYSPTAKLEKGKEYILFLYKPGRGGAYNTDGEYFYVLGLPQGVFEKNREGTFESQTMMGISMEYLKDEATKYPINEMFFREEYINNQKLNLKNGIITEEEYKELMEKIDEYAQVVEYGIKE